MKALDTNILLRYFIKDHPEQLVLARRLMHSLTEEDPGFINLVTIHELVWALKKIYGYDKLRIADTLIKILEVEQLQVENAEAARMAVELYRKHNVDFADALIGAINKQAGCKKTATFDKNAARLDAFELLK